MRLKKAMNIRQLLATTSAVCIFALGVGCRGPTGQQSLLGEWEDTDLRKTEHVSQFAKEVIDFRADGVLASYLVDRKGNRVQERPARYRVLGDVLEIGDGSMCYRFVVKGKNLSLKVVKSMAPDDIGTTMEFRRKE